MADAVPTLLGKNAPAGTATSIVVTLTRAQDAGTILIVDAGVAALSGTASATCADNRSVGNTYHADCIANNSNRPLVVFSCKPGTLLQSGDTVTVSGLVSGSSRFAAVYQVTNLDQTTWLNTTSGNPKTANATSASPNSGTLTLAAGSYWLFGVLASANASAATAGGDNQSGTYAILDQGGNLAAEHENVTPGSSLAYQAAFAQTSTASCTAMAVYNIAAGGTTFNITPSGAVTPTGGLANKAQKALAGAVTATGGLLKSVRKPLAGSVTATGAPFKKTQKPLAGSVTPTGAPLKAAGKALTGAVTPAGTAVKQVRKLLSGAVTATGALTLVSSAGAVVARLRSLMGVGQ